MPSLANIFCLILWMLAFGARADEYFVISGAHDPIGNSYSQYLQARSLAEHVRTFFPSQSLRVFFGMGYRMGSRPPFFDVFREESQGVLSIPKFLPAMLPDNWGALKGTILSALANSTEKNRMFLFVGGHGFPNRADPNFLDNCVATWRYLGDEARPQYLPIDLGCLSVSEMGQALDRRPGVRKLFAMSQCYSGGFHKMAIGIDGIGTPYVKRADLCGFTATTDDDVASGCAADPSLPGYQGYERYFTEQLTGMDLPRKSISAEPKASMREAHEAASIQDMTVDIPLSTSDFYLWQWGLMLGSTNFQPRTNVLDRAAVLRIFRSVFSQPRSLQDQGFQRKLSIYLQMEDTILRSFSFPWVKRSSVSVDDFNANMAATSRQLSSVYSRIDTLQEQAEAIRQKWIFPLWWKMILTPTLANRVLPDQLFSLEFGLIGDLESQTAKLNDWRALAGRRLLISLAYLSATNPGVADLSARYWAERDQRILLWANAQNKEGLGSAVAQINAINRELKGLRAQAVEVQRQQGLIRRLKVHRIILASWASLISMRDPVALSEIAGLLNCESTQF